LTDTVPSSEILPAAAGMPSDAETASAAMDTHAGATTPENAGVAAEASGDPARAVDESELDNETYDNASASDASRTDDLATEADESDEPRGFAALGLSEPILRAVAEMGYLTPTPIQLQAIPAILMGRDVLGVAQTGTGKTGGFTLPMLDILSGSRARARMPRSLILEPTRELALQVAENFVLYGKYLKLTHALIIGGESMSDQKDLLMRGVDVLIATPGRLIDMFERGGMLLTDARILVIDETDRMLDMGFIPDVERIVAMLPANRQTLFFSATMAPEIRRLADAFLKNPKLITVSRPATVATTITQRFTLVAEHDKREALRRLIRSEDVRNALIFCNRKRDVDILHKSLTRHGFSVGALHGDMAQPVRFATLEKFKAGDIRLLCCSDVAARGLDIGGLSHVFNFDVPIHAEDYVHRIGRTGRAGMEGRTFMLATPEDRLAFDAILKLTGGSIERMQIEGLDPVEWAEGDGRRRRGRAKPPVKGKPEAARPDTKKAAETPKPEAQKPEARRTEPRRAEARRPAPAAIPEVLPVRPERSEWQDRGPRRDPRRRDDDLGQAVVGFGEDVPAFMLVAARPKRGTASRLDDTEVEA
jgi:superfamily II DNA/RNA helicase